MNWTPDQQKAIEGRSGTMLVSAAAGSGKTAVLVERVIQRLCDKENSCSIENLLIVTFTKAAAAQMKEKISKALSKKIAENPDDRFLRKQKMMLPYANICTIDSFCINLVRENFYKLKIAPDFTILDEGKIKILENTAITTVIDRLYEENTEEFSLLTKLINNEKDDRKLISAVQTLYNLSRAYPFPESMLDSLLDSYKETPVAKTNYGKIIIDYTAEFVKSTIESIDYCLKLMEDEPELYAKYSITLSDDKILFTDLLEKLQENDWDEIADAVNTFAFSKLANAPRNYASSAKEIVSAVRKDYVDNFRRKISQPFLISEKDNAEDIASIAPAVKELIFIVKEYGKELAALKAEENGVDFSDTLHLAIDLLAQQDGDGFIRTEIARELGENYAEILVDEYQDVNKAQDIVFEALSRNDTNRFMVGDVKQSIYRFRQAMPEIFIGLKDKFTDYDGVTYPAKVNLGMNFRSRNGITEIVNFMFRQLMSKEAGKIEYDKNEHLVSGAAYDEEKQADTEVVLIECEDKYTKNQATYIGNRINEMIASGVKFGNTGDLHEATFKDFAILLRSSKDRAKTYRTTLEEMGIPTIADSEESFLEAPEIMFMISLIKVIDNPTNDIPLTAVLFSPVFGFTSDDLAKFRSNCRDGSIYNTLCFAKDNGNKKAEKFLESLDIYRELSVTMPAGEFTAKLIDETGYKSIAGAMKNGEERIANLNQFIETANAYDKTGIPGISGFIRFLDKLCDSNGNINSKGRKTEAANAVTITTVHKSKGLEYPVCFLASCEKGNNDMDTREDMLISEESGIGFKRITDRVKYPTLPLMGAKLSTMIASHSEELRVLYVAVTRPKEKLIILAADKDWNAKLTAIGSKIRKAEKISPYVVNSLDGFGKYLLYTLLRHPDAHALRNAAQLPASISLPCSVPLKTQIIRDEIIENNESPEEAKAETDTELLEKLREQIEYKYKYSELENVTAWRAASAMEENGFNEEFFASSRPAFISEGKLTPAERGIATHRFMQYCNFERILNGDISKNIENELDILRSEGMLNDQDAEAVNKKTVYNFFVSDLAKRIVASEHVYREYSFCASLPLREIYPEISEEQAENDIVVINGIADCAFEENGELVIIDYKTDRVKEEAELVARYTSQLEIYRRCLQMALDMPVKETFIYSFGLNKIIKL